MGTHFLWYNVRTCANFWLISSAALIPAQGKMSEGEIDL